MGREGHGNDHSSIALLQERFRKLQRVKEMREERELLKMFTEPKQLCSIPNTDHEPRLLFHHELAIPSRSPPQVSLTLWPSSSQGKQECHGSLETSVSMNPTNYKHTPSLQVSWKNLYDCDSDSESGVDTSLHL